MMVIRPINKSDFADLCHLAKNTGFGVTSLPDNPNLLQTKIDKAEKAFAKKVDAPHAKYLFVLEDTDTSKVVGVCGIEAQVGLEDVWYNYRISTTVNASIELGVHNQTPTLYLTNDLTGCTEVCSLFLQSNYRKNSNGLLLSKSRFLFLADFPEMFSEKVFAEMRGYSDEQGQSPFWESLGKKFFTMEFSRADYLTGVEGKSFIAELMPKYPIYLPFLSEEAQKVVGHVHADTEPARAMLETEGFNFNGFIDIFDGGPAIEAFVNNIRVVRESFKRHAQVVKNPKVVTGGDSSLYLVSNRLFSDFRVALVPGASIRQDTIDIPVELAEQLKVCSGDVLRAVSLREMKR
ncbi:arginine N-succinyltransferase [Alkalimarinus alittae]|uniref:Arginine N-succinyltransferase n=1 Tax=Alkalimarinus alittae TaxID=2961619 RepID=A0ABY6N4U0_9ALTE|nr:arginine N-succinyltransferase [Alkalimarinus alittae]UZE97012.1 arginine N-succinyltransferase [Alkalimarinus alittae]